MTRYHQQHRNHHRWSFLITIFTILYLSQQPSYADTTTTTTSSSSCHESSSSSDQTCRANKKPNSDYDDEPDPALKKMTFDIGDGEENFMAYVVPDVSTFYRMPPGSKEKKQPAFNGLAGKFYNLSPEHLVLVWDGGQADRTRIISYAKPFEAVGTATFPGHEFYFHPQSDPDTEIIRFQIVSTTTHYVWDPYDTEAYDNPWDVDTLNPDERPLYEKQKKTLRFAMHYREFTGRDYQSLYPRAPPMHKMWRGDYLGQEHWVETKETHFVKYPPTEELGKITEIGPARRLADSEPRLLSAYRSPKPTLNLTLTTISCAPRAFEIHNFLSDIEVQHILELATGMELGRSTVGSGGRGMSVDTRTSKNAWVSRNQSPVVDAIYRRAADLLRIDEALMRGRGADEYPELGTQASIAEHLQLVHYDPGQEYTAHHDWGYPDVKSGHQASRFATLLLYLNEGMTGGETSFPRWVNAETSDALKTVPKTGKAMLFYSLLPDGNADDLSQHAALPVIEGEKWLMNLWVWDPVFG